MSISRTASRLKKQLALRGVKVLKHDPEDGFSDATLYIAGNIYIQVGYDYVCVVVEKNDELYFYECSSRIEGVMSALVKAVNT